MVTSNQFSLTKFGPSDHKAAPSLAGGGSQPINALKKFNKTNWKMFKFTKPFCRLSIPTARLRIN